MPSADSPEELLIALIAQAEDILAKDKTPNGTLVSEFLMNSFLHLTQSSLGFVASAHSRANGSAYIKTHAISNIAWTPELNQWYHDNKEGGLVFSNLNTLFGAIATEARVILANDAPNDPRARGTPPGHPRIHNFLGIPLFSGSELIGAVGLANRPGGYAETTAAGLQPLTELTSVILRNLIARAKARKAAARKAPSAVAQGSPELQPLPKATPSPIRIAKLGPNDAYVTFDARTKLSKLSKHAETIFGPQSGLAKFSDLFPSVAGIEARMDPEGLAILATSSERLPVVARVRNFELRAMEVEVFLGGEAEPEYHVVVARGVGSPSLGSDFRSN